MIELLKTPRKRQRLSSLLGLTLDGGRLEGVVLRRTNGSLQVQQTFSASLSLDPLTAAPELVGREIRNHLDAAGVRERLCIIGLPLKWTLTTHAEVPPLAAEDLQSFLQIEAERGFPCDVSTLLVSSTRCPAPGDKQYALMAAIPRNHLALLESVFRAAKLKPISFSLGLNALQPARRDTAEGVLALAISETHVGLQLSWGGGVLALRTLEGAIDMEGGRRVLHPEAVVRETRITLGQLPAEVREKIGRVRVFGPRDLGQQLADELELRLEPLGLKCELVTEYAPGELGLQLPANTPVSSALSLAAERLAGHGPDFEFLPPRVTAWQQVSTRYASGKLRLAGAAAAALLVIVALLFSWQQLQLTSLGAQWSAMAPRVKELKLVNDQIHQYRPWYDDSLRGLTILRYLTEAFPETGVVTAKTVEIRELNAISCSGTARDYQALLKVMDQLRKSPGISEVKLNTIRGKSPMQFTFDFRWNEGGRVEN